MSLNRERFRFFLCRNFGKDVTIFISIYCFYECLLYYNVIHASLENIFYNIYPHHSKKFFNKNAQKRKRFPKILGNHSCFLSLFLCKAFLSSFNCFCNSSSFFNRSFLVSILSFYYGRKEEKSFLASEILGKKLLIYDAS